MDELDAGAGHSGEDFSMRGFSIRSLMLITLGAAMLIGIFSFGASVNRFHMQLVIAFAIPGASLGYDRWRTSRGVVIGTCISAVLGTVLVSSVILLIGW